MGYSTDFVGNLTITPSLNEAEIEYLAAFSASRRCERPGGPYVVPGNPRAETSESFPGDSYNEPAQGQPQLWCAWTTCWEGDCLAWSGTEKSYAMEQWLRYLIAHFLKPSGRAAGHPGFEDFTFDHRVDGMVVGCRRDTKELFALSVHNNRVRKRILNKGNRAWAGYPDLPYETKIDRWAAPVRRRRRDPADNVVALPAR